MVGLDEKGKSLELYPEVPHQITFFHFLYRQR